MSSLFSLPASPRHDACDAAAPAISTTTLRLSAGQSQLLQLPASSHLQLDQGELCLQLPPTWLAERMLQPQLTLRAGQGHWQPDGGWVQLHARSACTLSLYSVQPAPHWWAKLWRSGRLGWPWQRLVPFFCG